MSERSLLRVVAPRLVATLRRLLPEEVAGQLDGLVVMERRAHGDGCDYYTAARPDGAWGPGHETLGLVPGALHVDLVRGVVVCVEVLRGPAGLVVDAEA